MTAKKTPNNFFNSIMVEKIKKMSDDEKIERIKSFEQFSYNELDEETFQNFNLIIAYIKAQTRLEVMDVSIGKTIERMDEDISASIENLNIHKNKLN